MTVTDNRKKSSEKRAVWLRNYQRARGGRWLALPSSIPTNTRNYLSRRGYLMRLRERRGWTLVGALVLTLVFTYTHLEKTTHLDPSKQTQMSRTKATMEGEE
jgi:hypothetical protein